MTRRHYIALAGLVRDSEGFTSLSAQARFAVELAALCAADNQRFDRARFLSACQPSWLVGSRREALWDRITAS